MFAENNESDAAGCLQVVNVVRMMKWGMTFIVKLKWFIGNNDCTSAKKNAIMIEIIINEVM